MKTRSQEDRTRRPTRAFILAERAILSVAMWLVAVVVERRLLKAIKRPA
ncbi:MAG TPA: hypothetical protein VKA30_05860 [Actinomycetota bacterium]|nr:hypothetical protein [Actinomycetota bacterium]